MPLEELEEFLESALVEAREMGERWNWRSGSIDLQAFVLEGIQGVDLKTRQVTRLTVAAMEATIREMRPSIGITRNMFAMARSQDKNCQDW